MAFRAASAVCSRAWDQTSLQFRFARVSIFGNWWCISAILQLGMLPPLAYYFHRVTLAGPFANVPAVLLTGLVVPVGFFTLAASLVSHTLAGFLAKLLGFLLAMLDGVCAMVFPVARRELPDSGAAARADRTFRCARHCALRGDPPASERLVAMGCNR